VGNRRGARRTSPPGSRARWLRWYRSWEEQQERLNRNRERRFSALLDVLAASVPARFAALDLGCGPGSLSVRLLARFPRARCVAVDFDPVVQRIGEGAFGTLGGRLAWARADLGTDGWERTLPPAPYRAAVSTTALHWLDQGRLRHLYRDLARLLRPGGVFVNGDRMPWGSSRPRLADVAAKVRALRLRRAGLRGDRAGWGTWRAWWETARGDPELGPLFAARNARHVAHPRQGDLPLSTHLRALEEAGFRSADVVWRDLEDVLLLARR
jgi:SAM-dependent methyltransferase